MNDGYNIAVADVIWGEAGEPLAPCRQNMDVISISLVAEALGIKEKDHNKRNDKVRRWAAKVKADQLKGIQECSPAVCRERDRRKTR
jgi:hypothetical protein